MSLTPPESTAAAPRAIAVSAAAQPRRSTEWKAEAVNIRVPMTVVRGGLRLGSLFPGMLAKKKVQLANSSELDLSKVTYTDLEAMIKDIGEITVDVDGDAQVRIRCE